MVGTPRAARRLRPQWRRNFAMDSGVAPQFVARSTSAPFSNNSRAASTHRMARRTAASYHSPAPGRPPRFFPATVYPHRRVTMDESWQAKNRSVTPISGLVDVRAFVQQQPRRVDVVLARRRAVVAGVPFSTARSTSAPLSSNSRAASTWPLPSLSGISPSTLVRSTAEGCVIASTSPVLAAT